MYYKSIQTGKLPVVHVYNMLSIIHIDRCCMLMCCYRKNSGEKDAEKIPYGGSFLGKVLCCCYIYILKACAHIGKYAQ